MKIVINEQELEEHVVNILKDICNRVLLTILEDAIEAEADAICDGEDVYIIGIMEHVEPAEFTQVILTLYCLHIA